MPGLIAQAKNGEPGPADDILARLSIAGTGQMVIVRDISRADALIDPHLPLIPGQPILFSEIMDMLIRIALAAIVNGTVGLTANKALPICPD